MKLALPLEAVGVPDEVLVTVRPMLLVDPLLVLGNKIMKTMKSVCRNKVRTEKTQNSL